MDRKTPIDPRSWSRREHFEHYRNVVPCTYSLTVDLDVTRLAAALRQSDRKTYPTQTWAIASVVNRHEEFRLSVTSPGDPEVWEVVHPSFTVFNAERETFSSVWVRFDEDFARFHAQALDVVDEHRNATAMFPQAGRPANLFDISSLPWASFTGFTLDIAGGHDHFAPIFTLGRYMRQGDRVLLPLAVQIHHAAADGFHTARLVNELQELFDACGDWLR